MTALAELAPASRIYVAFDYPGIRQPEPQAVLQQLQDTGAGAKIGLEITAASGWPEPIQEAQQYGFDVFADAKLHDIGNTEINAARTILSAAPNMLNVHATSSKAALRGLVAVRNEIQLDDHDQPRLTKILGVTVLTDVENSECFEDYRRGRQKQVLHLADKVLDCGLDGFVCSPEELDILARYERFDRMLKVIPAIRPKWSVPDDQKNYTTPREAILRGASHIVVGRPITKQFKKIGNTQLDAFQAVEQEVAEAA
jgi:orotidine-5'-phosphate decarboxylase